MRKIFFVLFLFVSQAWAIAPPSILVYNTTTGHTVYSENQDTVRPMASITKLMTAMVALDYYSLDQKIAVGKKSTITVRQLLTQLLVRSDNNASEVLARAYPNGRGSFLDSMNAKAKFLGLKYTEYHDPSGLLATNLTTASELVKVVAFAGQYAFIKETSTLIGIERVAKVKNKFKKTLAPNTNQTILFEFDNILVSKTGFTSRAGRCLAMLVDSKGEQYAIIILGEPTKQARDQLARILIKQV